MSDDSDEFRQAERGGVQCLMLELEFRQEVIGLRHEDNTLDIRVYVSKARRYAWVGRVQGDVLVKVQTTVATHGPMMICVAHEDCKKDLQLAARCGYESKVGRMVYRTVQWAEEGWWD